jgi:hypothetical protein
MKKGFSIFIQTKIRLISDQIQVIRRYYKNKRFFLADCALFFSYLFSNPYRISRKFLEKKGAENIYAYGETPLPTLEKIVRAFDIRSENKWLDLGSGRGRGCFWISEFWGCEAKGIEWIPQFVSRASLIAKYLPSSQSEFHNTLLENGDFSWPDVVYLCGTCMSNEEIQSLLIRMQSLHIGTKVITITEPLNHPSYKLIQSIPVSFIWGETDAYLQIKSH